MYFLRAIFKHDICHIGNMTNVRSHANSIGTAITAFEYQNSSGRGLLNIDRANKYSLFDRYLCVADDLKLAAQANILRRATQHDFDPTGFEDQIRIQIIE